MINLIPPKAKKNIKIEYWVRVLTVCSVLLAIVFVAAASSLLPAYVLINSQTEVYRVAAEAASQKVAGYENASASLVQASQQAKFAVDEKQLPQFSTFIALFEALQGQQIQINTMQMGRDEKGLTPLVIGGVATNRQALASFRDRLLASEVVFTVDLPISNLARDKDITFTITVVLHNQESV